MNEGESPDETGESGVDPSSADEEHADRAAESNGVASEDGTPGEDDTPEGEATSPEGTGADETVARGEATEDGDDATANEVDGASTDSTDPAEEVEAAVREVMGPDALDRNATANTTTVDRGTATGPAGGEAAETKPVGREAAETEPEGGPATDDDSQATDDDAPGEGTVQSPLGDQKAPSVEVDQKAPLTAEDQEDLAAGKDQEDPSTKEDMAAAEAEDVPADVRKYDRFKKIEGGTYDRANEFLRDRTYITAREWAMARLCADFRTETGVEMTKIGENLPELVPFMTDTYTPQAVNQARSAFEEKVRKAGATFLYGAMCDFFTAEELDDVMYEATEVAKFLLEVEGVELSVEEELAAEDRISEVMREVREQSAALRHDEVTCPECGHDIQVDE